MPAGAFEAPGASGSAKIVIAGPAGAGKTTLIRTLTGRAIEAFEDWTVGQRPDSATVQWRVRHGRVAVANVVLTLLALPTDAPVEVLRDLTRGACGAVLLADPAAVDQTLFLADQLAENRVPFVVALNRSREPAGGLHQHLHLDPAVPLVLVDAAVRAPARNLVLDVLRHAQSLDQHVLEGDV